MADYVIASGNEKGFEAVADKLGLDLQFLYEGINFIRFDDTRKIPKLKRPSFVCSKKKVREAVEMLKPDVVFEVERSCGKDLTHQRASSLDPVICKLAKKFNVAVGFSFSSVLAVEGLARAKLVGRMKQNIRLCRKYGVKIIFASFARSPMQLRNPKDIKSFFDVLARK